jgi:hypothetical protein
MLNNGEYYNVETRDTRKELTSYFEDVISQKKEYIFKKP